MVSRIAAVTYGKIVNCANGLQKLPFHSHRRGTGLISFLLLCSVLESVAQDLPAYQIQVT